MKDKPTKTYNWNLEFTLRPVGFVASELKDPSLIADGKGLVPSEDNGTSQLQTCEIKQLVSRIIINPDLQGILEGLEKFSHALILYWPHLAKEGSRNMRKVHPMGRQDLPKVGIFASCSPARPNPVLVTAVRVLNVEDNGITVQGLEAVDESPVLDIKPYTRHYLEAKDLKLADWMDQIERSLE